MLSATAPTERALPLSEENKRQPTMLEAGWINEGIAANEDCSRRHDAKEEAAFTIRSIVQRLIGDVDLRSRDHTSG